MSFRSFSTFLLLALTCRSSFAEMIGPVADLVIVAAEVAPDGFSRTAALAGGTVIGPVVTGNKVRLPYFLALCIKNEFNSRSGR
jgi:iron transport multicopper oxidase